MEEDKKIFNPVKAYKLMTKKIEAILTVGTLALFMFSLSGGTFSSVLFFAVTGLILLYYFVIFRKKPHYVIMEGDKVTVYDGIWLTPVVINTGSISKVSKTDKAISIGYSENGSEKSVEIKALILDAEDFKEIYGRLS